jgi:hypothetical protein
MAPTAQSLLPRLLLEGCPLAEPGGIESMVITASAAMVVDELRDAVHQTPRRTGRGGEVRAFSASCEELLHRLGRTPAAICGQHLAMLRRDFDAGRPPLGHEFGPTACPGARFAAQVVVADFGLVHGHARQAFPRRIELMRLRVWHAAADNDLVQHLKGAGLSLLRSRRAHAMDFTLRLLRSAAHRRTAKRTLQSSSYRLHAMKPF